MPPKGKTRALAAKFSFIGQFSSNNKTINGMDRQIEEQNIITREKQETMNALDIEIKQLESDISQLDIRKGQLEVENK